MDQITLQSPFDMHLHLRDGEILQNVAQHTAKSFSYALIMPNLNPPILDTKSALAYQQRILQATQGNNFTPIMSLYLNENLGLDDLQEAKDNGIFILKLYPKGATTGSENGVSEILSDKILEILEIAQNLGMILSIHGETNGFVLDREVEFHSIFEYLAKNFPKLKIIFEHLSDRRSIPLVEKYDNLFATLTLHHILLNLDDVIGGMLNPHYFCKPILKTKKDQESLLQTALQAHQKFSFGSDSAPHLKSNKESQKGSAGIFSAPILLQALTQTFEAHNALENLESFISINASKIYGLTRTSKQITLTKKPFQVPQEYAGIVPMFAGQTLQWSLA